MKNEQLATPGIRLDKLFVQGPQAPAEPGTSGAAPAPGSAGAPGADAPPLPEHCVSYNERDILRKLHEIQIAVYHGTNKPRSLDDLDALGSRTPKEDEEECKNDANNPAKSIVDEFLNLNKKVRIITIFFLRPAQKDMITRIEGTLEKILEKTTEDETKTEVEKYVIHNVFTDAGPGVQFRGNIYGWISLF